ncbi:MAG: transposase, partial [Candidatus Aminicenantes bacterium]|nr:transposase [Candidatus Aminicenantes bacterium]
LKIIEKKCQIYRGEKRIRNARRNSPHKSFKPVVWFHDFKYRAASWHKRHRVVAKIEWHQGDLFPRVGFIVTNMSAEAEGVVQFYNKRGIVEQWIKEGKYALSWTRLSCKHFLSNQVRLGLFVLAYNLGNFLRRLVLPRKIKHWSLRSLLVKLIKIGAKVLKHSRYITFQMAEVAIKKELFAEIVSRINRFRCCSLQ